MSINVNNVKRANRLLFVGPCKRYFRSFMQWDLDILERDFDVRLVNYCLDRYELRGTFATPFSLVAGIAWADVIFCWFAQSGAFAATALSRLLNKKTAVVVGGADVTTIPEIQYGLSLSKIKRFYSPFVLRKATKLLPYSREAEKRALDFLNDAAKVKLIYLGVDVERFRPSGTKKDKVITVGDVNRTNVTRKGLETFVKSAEHLPQIEFTLIGKFADNSINYLRSIAPENVRFAGSIPERELIRCYQEAKVYVQVSAHEAFGVAIAEAMACECVTVVTSNGAIPEVVGDTGIYVAYADPMGTAQGIEQALSSDKGRAGRQRIEKMFAIGRRQEALLTTITDLLD